VTDMIHRKRAGPGPRLESPQSHDSKGGEKVSRLRATGPRQFPLRPYRIFQENGWFCEPKSPSGQDAPLRAGDCERNRGRHSRLYAPQPPAIRLRPQSTPQFPLQPYTIQQKRRRQMSQRTAS